MNNKQFSKAAINAICLQQDADVSRAAYEALGVDRGGHDGLKATAHWRALQAQKAATEAAYDVCVMLTLDKSKTPS